ncbi:hypothetical protein OAO55_02055 [Bacteroidales bacterium]|nr:hypothetical protein [Bacteroidales bacterium]
MSKQNKATEHVRIKNYTAQKQLHQLSFKRHDKHFNMVGIVRFILTICFAYCMYYYFKTKNPYFILYSVANVFIFIAFIKAQNNIGLKRKIEKSLIKINADEIDFLNHSKIPFDNGNRFIDANHAYSYDLDIFGENSLYQTLNRTATIRGQQILSQSLLTLSSNKGISQNKEAIKELAPLIEWRQKLQALAIISDDDQDAYDNIQNWIQGSTKPIHRILSVLSYISPILLLISIIGYFVTKGGLFSYAAQCIALANIFILLFNIKSIKKEIISTSKIDELLRNYSRTLKFIETQPFNSEKLKYLQAHLVDSGRLASSNIQKLSSLYLQLESVQNPIGAFIFNGVYLYHIHLLRSIRNWKKENARHVISWFNVIGEFEMLNSLANFSYNNPSFTFAELNDKHHIEFRKMGHPLINENSRVPNNVDFCQYKFMVLTGSNMSGKSTFLRSLGINMILAGIGAPVCAKEANIHPLNILVSMRLTDSLSENESYFLAEVHRLKDIMDAANNEISLVLLDEILKGTNSDDKRAGTMGVINKLMQKNAIGVIATHDLKVCAVTNNYPELMINKCFEVQFIDKKLYFDYQIKDGVCKNKSATFIMENMNII